MAATLESLGIDRMSIDERLILVDEINESVRAERQSPDLPPAFLAELRRRVADAKANPEDSIPWETVRDEALARMKSGNGDCVARVFMVDSSHGAE